MANHNLIYMWEQIYPHTYDVIDYAGRRMLKSAIGNQQSRYCPTIDHIRPLSLGGKDTLANIIICNRITNEEKQTLSPTGQLTDRDFRQKESVERRTNMTYINLIRR